MHEHRLRWLILALAAAACGAGIAWQLTRSTPLPSGRYRLVISELTLGQDVVYTEGFRSYVAVSAAAGGGTSVTVPRTDGPAFSRRLAPGRYVITSWLRPCDGNCGTLDAPTGRCRLTVTVGRGRPANYDVLVHPGHACRIEPVFHG